jgi:hypothetical protein
METKTVDAKIMQESLNVLYWDVNEKIRQTVKEKNRELPDKQKAVNPLFIHVSDEYAAADVRLMVFGQETNTWGGCNYDGYDDPDMVSYLIDSEGEDDCDYKSFFTEKACYRYGGHFWNLVKKFIGNFQAANNGKNINYIWNNLIKMGLTRNNPGTTPYWYDNIIKLYFNDMILREIDILKPDFLVFFTGPNYDRYINDIFGKPQKNMVSDFSENELCEFVIPNIKKVFRTYHPGYLYRNNSKRPYNDYINTIVKEMSSCIK